jgi:hypothetical protein
MIETLHVFEQNFIARNSQPVNIPVEDVHAREAQVEEDLIRYEYGEEE